MKEEFRRFHEKFTTESNTIVKIDDLLTTISYFSDEEQIIMLESIINISDDNNKKYIEENKEYKALLNKREDQPVIKRKVVTSKPLTKSTKKYLNNEIEQYQNTIKKLCDLSYADFVSYLKDIEQNEINYLILGLYKEINSYQKIAEEAYASQDKDFLTEIKKDTEELEKKIKLLKAEKDLDKEENIDQNKNIKIIFLETSSGRPYFLEDISGRDEYYQSFQKLLDGLLAGEPIDSKVFSNNDSLNGYTETRDVKGQTRIFYDQITPDTYVVIQGIIKKVDKSLSYKNQLKNRYKTYLASKDNLLKCIEDDEYLNKQSIILENIQSVLTKDQKKKIK